MSVLNDFLTPEFISENDYSTAESSHAAGEFRVASTEPDDLTKKLLLKLTNFGKSTILVEDGKYENQNGVLLADGHTGSQAEVRHAAEILKRVFEPWGEPVNVESVTTEGAERE